MRRSWTDSCTHYFGYLSPPDVHAGARTVTDLLGEGATVVDIVQKVLRPAQIEVGRLWQANEWTVADEHAASAVTEAALMAAAASINRYEPMTARVVLACPAGEWHTLPLRMVSEILAEAGFECVFLGASVPAGHLRQYLERTRPVAVALSCSHPLSLEGLGEATAAAHSVGTPVVVGGRGLGADGHRAAQIGADAWADDPITAATILAAWAECPPAELATPPAGPDEPAPDDLELLAVRTHVMTALRRRFQVMQTYDAQQLARTYEDIDFIARFAILAARYKDERIFSEFAAWLREVLTARHVPRELLDASLLAAAGALEKRRPESSSYLRQAAVGTVALANFRAVG